LGAGDRIAEGLGVGEAVDAVFAVVDDQCGLGHARSHGGGLELAHQDALARFHALWTLEGLGALNPALVRSATLGGLGIRLVDGVGLPVGIADALEAPSLADVTDPMGRMFRAFAESTRSDLVALAACIRGSRQTLSAEQIARLRAPFLICVGTTDTIAGDPHALAALIPNARAIDIPGRDHNLAVGDKVFKQAVLSFLAERP